ncbi:hypothetical protein DAI22_11g202150 [Oryza sativa Japonica Group]|nr:hypothetical protein DAI22_11g202150 [Oryza sativa Japonica Group]
MPRCHHCVRIFLGVSFAFGFRCAIGAGYISLVCVVAPWANPVTSSLPQIVSCAVLLFIKNSTACYLLPTVSFFRNNTILPCIVFVGSRLHVHPRRHVCITCDHCMSFLFLLTPSIPKYKA